MSRMYSPQMSENDRIRWNELAKLPESELLDVFHNLKRISSINTSFARPWFIAVGGVILFGEDEDILQSMYLALVTGWKQQNFDVVYNHIRKNNPLGIV